MIMAIPDQAPAEIEVDAYFEFFQSPDVIINSVSSSK